VIIFLAWSGREAALAWLAAGCVAIAVIHLAFDALDGWRRGRCPK
jgi:hypothetical protein